MKLREGLYLIPDVRGFLAFEAAPGTGLTARSSRSRYFRRMIAMTAVRAKAPGIPRLGRGHVWLVDPHSRRLYTCDTGLTEVNSFSFPELNLELGPAEIFD